MTNDRCDFCDADLDFNEVQYTGGCPECGHVQEYDDEQNIEEIDK